MITEGIIAGGIAIISLGVLNDSRISQAKGSRKKTKYRAVRSAATGLGISLFGRNLKLNLVLFLFSLKVSFTNRIEINVETRVIITIKTAAHMDGLVGLRKLARVDLPYIKASILSATVLMILYGSFTFDPIYIAKTVSPPFATPVDKTC